MNQPSSSASSPSRKRAAKSRPATPKRARAKPADAARAKPSRPRSAKAAAVEAEALKSKPTKAKQPKTKRGERTRAKLLEAAEFEFGERGFHEAAIGRITERAGVALGTFYVYFESKEEVFRDLVEHMGRLTRVWIAQRIDSASDRITAERQGFEAFIDFVGRHRNLYRIVMESQFVAEDAYRKYYMDFAKEYRDNLSRASKAGEIRDGDDDVRAWALMGMNVFLGMRFAVWEDRKSARTVANAVGDLIAHGLAKEAAPAREKGARAKRAGKKGT